MATEQKLEFSKGLRAGLRTESYNEKNSQLFTLVQNMKVTQFGLKEFDAVSLPFSALPKALSFPFPQLFIGKKVTLLAYGDALYEVDTTTTPWTATIATLCDALDSDLAKEITVATTTPWQFIDLYDYWLLVSAKNTIFKTHHKGLIGAGTTDDILVASDTVPINAGCYHKGRIVLGGFTPGSFWNATWAALFNHWVNASGTNFNVSASADAPGENFVLWSSIGGGDFPLVLFFPNTAGKYNYIEGPGPYPSTEGYSQEAEPYIFQALRKNQLGWMPMPFQGAVLKILPLGNDLAVYTENGIARMFTVAELATYGMAKILDVGVPYAGAVCGDEAGHIFIDTSGALWRLNPDFSYQRLGYSEFFSNYVDDEIMISLNPAKRDFYINVHGVQTYLLTPSGLSSLYYYLDMTSGGFLDGDFVAIRTAGTVDRSTVKLQTDVLDMGHRGIKTITRVDLGITGPTDADVAKSIYIYYKKDEGTTFSGPEGPFSVDNAGVAWCYISGVEFKVQLQLSSADTVVNAFDDIAIDWMNIWYMNVDRRFMRGRM